VNVDDAIITLSAPQLC